MRVMDMISVRPGYIWGSGYKMLDLCGLTKMACQAFGGAASAAIMSARINKYKTK